MLALQTVLVSYGYGLTEDAPIQPKWQKGIQTTIMTHEVNPAIFVEGG